MSHAIREFPIAIPQAQLDDLQARLVNARLPETEPVGDWSQGIPSEVVADLHQHWRNNYDWRDCEQVLNRYPHFVTEIDGLDIHFMHIRSQEPSARPLIISHGWPGSVVEFLDIIEPLINPTAHGGQAADAYHLVIPSLPGFGFSGKPAETGWNVERIAGAWDQLMLRLGYSRYLAQGGDWGAMVTALIGEQNLGHCAGLHLNLLTVGAPGKTIRENPTRQEKASLQRFTHYLNTGQGYAQIQATRPQTLGYALADSPVGQMAWIVEKFGEWHDDGDFLDHFGRDRLLNNVMMYWLNNAATSSARLYWESFARPSVAAVNLPTACSIFPGEFVQPSKRWAAQRFTDIQYWNEVDKGGHFAAMDQPALFVEELRAGLAHLQL